MTKTCKYVALKNYIPQGLPSEDDFEIKTKEIKLNNENNIHVLNSWISVDPYMRARMTERKNYKPPFKLGDDGKPIFNENGKVMKGPNYFKPNLNQFLK